MTAINLQQAQDLKKELESEKEICGTCECISSKNIICGKIAVAKVKLRNDNLNRPYFNVCEDCLPAFEYIQGKEYGNTKSAFIIKKFTPTKKYNELIKQAKKMLEEVEKGCGKKYEYKGFEFFCDGDSDKGVIIKFRLCPSCSEIKSILEEVLK